jgi:predicted CoA-binding protein
MMLETTSTLTILGAGLNEEKPAHRLFHDLDGKGWRLVPIHPRDKGTILSSPIEHSIGPEVAKVLVFFLSPQQTLSQLIDLQENYTNNEFPFIWLQPGAADDDVLTWLNAEGIPHVVDECVVEFIHRHHISCRASY